MNLQLDIFKVEMQDGQNCILKDVRKNGDITEYDFLFTWTKENAANDDTFTVAWTEPAQGIMYKWDATCNQYRAIAPHWHDVFRSMISQAAPVSCMFDGTDTNRYCWALSECCKLMNIKNAVDDSNGYLSPRFFFKVGQYTNQFETLITLRIDRRAVTARKAVEDVATWWATDIGLTPIRVPDDAREPLYSFWYSYHQDVDEKTVEEECRRAKALGFNICIVDDGWQTENNFGGYAYCGDWQPAPNKFPDMASHVKRVHDIGMKYMMWYSVPFVGYNSVHYNEFKGMFLRDEAATSVAILDPRYKEVRDFLIGTYKKALIEWDLDGFKLNFLEHWTDNPNNAPYNEKMDIPAVLDAVNVCMSDIAKELTAIKPDILLEFRQSYIGPCMKQFGNMFRVGDCAGNYLRNRAAIFDMRMIMGDQAVHSDMLMIRPFEDPKFAAMQIISCMFGVMQFSGRLDLLDDESIKMSRFWLSFLKEHRALLQSKNFETFESHLLYTWAKATLGDECIVGVYAIDKCVKLDAMDTVYIANGCMGERVLVDIEGTYRVRVLDCCGDDVKHFEKFFSGVETIDVPIGGLVILKKI